MTCPRCQHENPVDATFCDECGARLEAACAACGEPNRQGAKFCRKCGQPLIQTDKGGQTNASRFTSPERYTPKHLAEKILTSKAALEGERKQVTVLFADLKGSMELLADRDPEEARKLLDPVLERMMEAVHRYEGTVNQVMGDGIMALFGAPLAHEDHAVRACYAALRMQESVKRYADELSPLARRGRADPRRPQLRRGRRARRSAAICTWTTRRSGQTTHLAARMEQLATPGTDPAHAATAAARRGLRRRCRPLGPVPVKGLAGARRGLRADRERARAHAAPGGRARGA